MKFITLTQLDYQCTEEARRERVHVNVDKIVAMAVIENNPKICLAVPVWTEITFETGVKISVEECPEEIERRISSVV